MKKIDDNPQRFSDILASRVSQAESQKVRVIDKVLFALDKEGSLNTTDIKTSTGLSWNAVIRTMRLLLKKKVVKLSRIRNKNNEKIYTLKRVRAFAYLQHLFLFKCSKDWRQASRPAKSGKLTTKFAPEHFPYRSSLPGRETVLEIRMSTKYVKARDGHLTRFFPQDLLGVALQVPTDGGLRTIIVKKLPYPDARKIMNDWFLGRYCYGCFDNRRIHLVNQVGDERWCTNCGKSDPLPGLGIVNDPKLESRRREAAYEERRLLDRLKNVGRT